MNDVRSILFVCTGNICRSPLAEALLKEKLAARGCADRFEIDSAGTVADHLGEPADTRMRRTAARHGVQIHHRARRVTRADFQRFDLVIGMDDGHIATLRLLTNGGRAELRKLREFGRGGGGDVPDPWYGGMAGFERVYAIIDRACDGIADRLTEGV